MHRLIGRGVFANGLGDRGLIPDWVILKTQKLVLDAALLNTQHYKIQTEGKVKLSREKTSYPLYLSVIANERRVIDYGRQQYKYIYN